MIRLLPFLLLLSCSIQELPTPVCLDVEATRTGNHLLIRVHSESDEIMICRDGANCRTVDKAYFNCIGMTVDSLEEITVEDSGCKCQVKF